jgi:glycosyltransferase involved in cell wall biosynthesis
VAEHHVPTLILSAKDGFTSELVQGPNLTFGTLRHSGKQRMTMVPRGLMQVLRSGDVVFLHEGWTLSNYAAGLICVMKKIPYVVMPHGVYAPELVSSLRLVKIRSLFERALLRHAAATHVFFEREKSELEGLFGSLPTVVVTTGFDSIKISGAGESSPRYFSWLGRYDVEHKGIDRLLKALAQIASDERPRLVMHGPDHRGDKKKVLAMVSSLGLEKSVSVEGELTPDESRAFLEASSGFVHVPRWEAFGRTIVEAMSLGVPVLLSSDAQIAGVLEEAGAATIVDANDHEALKQSLIDFNRISRSTGRFGRVWVQENLSWESRIRELSSQLKDLGLSAPKELKDTK